MEVIVNKYIAHSDNSKPGYIGITLLQFIRGPRVLVQRELDNFALRLREYLAFGKEVFLGIGEFWITIARECSGRPI
jgi:hypothetical protein